MMKERKDVVFLCQFFYPEYVSSATLPYDTALALAAKGLKVGALCGYPNEYLKKTDVPLTETVNGIYIKRLRYMQLKRTNPIGRLLNYISLTLAALFNIRELKKYKKIVVYSNPPMLPWVAYIAKKLYKCELVFIAYDLYPEIALKTNTLSNNSLICKVMNYINKKLFPVLDNAIVLSSDMKNFVEKNRMISKDKIKVIPNWYEDVKDLTHNSDYNNSFYDLLKGKTVISYLGNMGTCQDIDTIIQSAMLLREHQNIVFVFAGHGNKVDYIKTIKKDNNLENIMILGFLCEQEYLDMLAMSSFAVVSLEKGLTGLCTPSKTYAYMMSSIPIIVISDKDNDLYKEITDSKAGFAVANGSAEEMAKEIIKYSSDLTTCDKMKKNSRALFLKKYEKSLCLDLYTRLFTNEE